MHRQFLACLIVVSLATAPCESSGLQRFQTSQIHLGTSLAIVMYAPDAATANHAFQAAFQRVQELNAILSDYDSGSEVMRLCQSAATPVPVAVSAELCFVLAESQELSRRSDGAFDVTVGPLTKLWRRARRRHELPRASDLASAMQAVGYQHLKVDREECTVELRKPGMRIDLGAIAKGYISDEILVVLSKHGLSRSLVNAGGEVTVGDPPPDEPGWRTGIAGLNPKNPPSQYLRLANASVATSGDAWQHLDVAGERFSHILNPRTGFGLKGHTSVSVVAPNGITADALATAVSSLGLEKGLALIEATPQAAVRIVRDEDGKEVARASSRWSEYLERPSPPRP